ncbi:MAG: hypothetical protein HC888_01585 [Candidatus Competibacteraceae bacterium]|nr:hypothetical protein [Candidatus Competibacteraceae bacterium]
MATSYRSKLMFSPATPCPYCDGHGETHEMQQRSFGPVEVHTPCERCNGTGYLPRGEGELRTIVITGSGDIELGARLCEKYGCHGLIAPLVDGRYAYGYLHMTTIDPRKLTLVAGVEFIDVDEALKVLL